MAYIVTHRKVATLADQPGAEVNKGEWNDTHVIVGNPDTISTATITSANIVATTVTAGAGIYTTLTAGGYDLVLDAAKLALLPTSAIQNVGENGTTNTTGRGRINFATGGDGLQIVDNSGTNSKDINLLPYLSRNTGNVTLTDDNSVQSWLQAGNSTFTAVANITYEVEGRIIITGQGVTSHNIGLVWNGTANFTTLFYDTIAWSSAAMGTSNTAQATNIVNVSTITTVITGVTADTTCIVIRRGLFSMSSAGTIIPQLKLSVATTGAPLVAAGSYLRLIPIGTDTLTTIGSNWS